MPRTEEPLTLDALDSGTLYSPSQVAAIFGRTREWARQQYHAGKIKGIRTGAQGILFLGIEVKLYAGRCGWTPTPGPATRKPVSEKRAIRDAFARIDAAMGRKTTTEGTR